MKKSKARFWIFLAPALISFSLADIRTDVLFQKARRNRQVITDAVIIQSLQHAAVPPFSTSSLS